MRAFLVLIALVGCAPEGRELRTWQLLGTDVQLPTNALIGVLPTEKPYRLSSLVALEPAWQGETLTLSLECFHGPLALYVNGREIPNIGDHGVGEHRFVIAGERTRMAQLALELEARDDVLGIGFGVAPRLSLGARTEPSAIARFNRNAAVIDLALIVVFALMFGLSYALDRRRIQDGAFAMGVAASSVAPLVHLGLLFGAGRMTMPLIGLSTCVTNIAVLYFVHYSFSLGPPPRWIVRAYLALIALLPFTPLVPWLGAAWTLVHFALDVPWIKHILVVLFRQARAGNRALDARLLLAILVLLFLMISPDIFGFTFGHSPFGGVHTLMLGAACFAMAQAFHLAREQVSRQRELEHTAEELRRQVAERSRELSAALGKLAQAGVSLDENRTIDGRYRVVKKLGQGGMGAVYEVERTSDGKRFALKTLRGRADTDLMARFAREAQIAAEISHPHLVPVLDVGIADGGLFLVMPLVGGGSLEQARKQYGNVAWAKPLLAQIADGLAALHARDIVHRDLKPANILLADGKARIADFGLATLRVDTLGETLPSSGALADTAAASPLTRRGDLFGTPAYMAPELAAGVEDAKPSSDIFAFGMIAYELLTGRQPFAEPPVIARLHGRAIDPPKLDGVPPIIARCLDLDAGKRPSAAELIKELT